MNEGETELLAAVRRVVEAFDALGVDYLVGGSIASSVLVRREIARVKDSDS